MDDTEATVMPFYAVYSDSSSARTVPGDSLEVEDGVLFVMLDGAVSAAFAPGSWTCVKAVPITAAATATPAAP
jgi:hypothetical protein